MSTTMETFLTSALNAVKTAYPRADSYIDVSIPGAANGSGDPLAAIIVAAVTSVVPLGNRDFGADPLSDIEQTELVDLIARRLNRMATDINTVKAALIAIRATASITLQT